MPVGAIAEVAEPVAVEVMMGTEKSPVRTEAECPVVVNAVTMRKQSSGVTGSVMVESRMDPKTSPGGRWGRKDKDHRGDEEGPSDHP